MSEFVNLWDKIKRYYKFTPSELKGFIISILVIALIIGFDDGRANFSFYWFINLFNCILLVTLTFIVRESAHKIGALQIGYRVEYKMWTWGLLLGFVFALVSRGKIWILLPGGFIVHHLAGHRLGWMRYGINYFAMGVVSLWAPISNIILVMIFKTINNFVHNPVIDKLILLNIALAIWTMLPIPPMDGSKIFYGSRLFYAFTFSSVIAAAILLYVDINVWLAIIGAILIGIICWLLYYIFLERFLWQGPAAGMKK